MRLNEVFDNELDVITPTPEQLAGHHNVPLEDILDQLEKGIKVEFEHTSDEELSREIALDHLLELPDYYDRLADMENNQVDEDILNRSLARVKGNLISPKSKRKIEKLLDKGVDKIEIGRMLGLTPRATLNFFKSAGL